MNTWRMRNVRVVNYCYALLLLKLILIVLNALYMYLGGIVPIILLALLCSLSAVYLITNFSLSLSFFLSLSFSFFLVMHQNMLCLINLYLYIFICFLGEFFVFQQIS